MFIDFNEKKILESIAESVQKLLNFIREAEKIINEKNQPQEKRVQEYSAIQAILIEMINAGEMIYKNLYAVLFYENIPTTLPNVCAINKLERYIGEIPIILEAIELKNHYLKKSSPNELLKFQEKALKFIPVFKHFAISVKSILAKKESGEL